MPSAVDFTRRFSRAMAEAAQTASPDTRLCLLLQLWDELGPVRAQPQFSSFVEEYQSALTQHATEASVRNLSLAELGVFRTALTALGEINLLPLVCHEIARLHAYVGDIANAVTALTSHYGEEVDLTEIIPTAPGISEIRLLELTVEKLAGNAPHSASALKSIQSDWVNESSALHQNKAWCLLVQSGPHLPGPRGCLLQLSGHVDITSHAAERFEDRFNDRVAFGHQLKAPDDPAVEGVYSALVAVRGYLESTGVARQARTHSWSVQYQLADNDHLYTGDSLSLAAGLVTLAGILKTELFRHERYISGEVGFTGSVDGRGHIGAVNGRTLPLKISRAFFSHLKYLVIPSANRDDAERALAELVAAHPRRRLQLIAAETLGEVAENHNVIRPEKLCPAAYAGKIARKYTRSTAVQVPLLILLVLLMGFVITDRILTECQKPWGDCNPAYVETMGEILQVYNVDSSLIWQHRFPCPLCEPRSQAFLVGDIDGDIRNEVLVMASRQGRCGSDDQLNVFSFDGRLLWQRDCRIIGEYPGDKDSSMMYTGGTITLEKGIKEAFVASNVSASNPARDHIRLWDKNGQCRNWYIQAGAGGDALAFDIGADGTQEIVCAGCNTRMNTMSVFALTVDSTFGVSPPYTDNQYDVTWVKRGNQPFYAILPTTRLCDWFNKPISSSHDIILSPDSPAGRAFAYITREGDPTSQVYYYFDVNGRVVSADFSDDFCMNWARMVGIPKVNVKWSALADTLVRQCSYWTDSGWVTEGALRELEQTSAKQPEF